jgi:hypothetical protein
MTTDPLGHPRDSLDWSAEYRQGEVAALDEAMASVLSEGPVAAVPLVREIHGRWAHRANSLSASPSPARRAYHEGGRDALAAFLEAAGDQPTR